MRRDLVEAAARGDHDAFEVLATSAGDRLYAVARLILRSSDLAEDAVQEALVRAWRQLPSLRDPDRFDAWLHRLLVNACADQGRQSPALVAAGATTAARTLHRRRHRFGGRSRSTRARLQSPEARSAGRDRPPHYSGFSAAEIAKILGIPEGTARSRLHYSTDAMRAALEADARVAADAHQRTA